MTRDLPALDGESGVGERERANGIEPEQEPQQEPQQEPEQEKTASSFLEDSILVNQEATFDQLEYSSSQLDGVPKHLEDSIRYHLCRLIQAVGILLELPQDEIVAAIVFYIKFWMGPEGGSLLEIDAIDVAICCVKLATNLTLHLRELKDVVTSFIWVVSRLGSQVQSGSGDEHRSDQGQGLEVDKERLQARCKHLAALEGKVLGAVGFDTRCNAPHVLCVTYLQQLEIFNTYPEAAREVTKQAFAHLNSSLLNPQLPYITHQPAALAVAAIYLAAREVGVKLPEGEWWIVFDVDREELGFLVVSMLSVAEYAKEEYRKWVGTRIPQTVQQVEEEMARLEESQS